MLGVGPVDGPVPEVDPAPFGMSADDDGALGVAERLGLEPTVFPSHRGGFLGGEFGQHGDPDAFGPKLREVLEARCPGRAWSA